MKWVVIIVLIVDAALWAYTYKQDPHDCAKLGNDLKADWPLVKADLVTIFTQTNAPAAADSDSDEPVTAENWAAPTTIPSQPDWTWTTSQGTFRNVHILKIEPDCVTILHTDGQAVVPIAELPSDLQSELNYSPAAAEAYAAQRGGGGVAPAPARMPTQRIVSDDALPQNTTAVKTTPFFTETTNYNDALTEAKRTNRKVLLHFTGSDWCEFCQLLEKEVLRTREWDNFAGANFITVTLDFPHEEPIADDLKAQNSGLAQKYGVHSFPTLIVIDTNEKELGRASGYAPDSGPEAVIGELQQYVR